MDMKMNKKHIVLIAIIIVVVFLAGNFIGQVTSDNIVDADVNLISGEISFLTLQYEIYTYDRFGNFLYKTELINSGGGYASLEYIAGNLHVKNYRTPDLYVLNEKGEVVLHSTYTEYKKEWQGWMRTSLAYVYTTDTTIYQYHIPNYWKYICGERNFSIEITDVETQTSKTIWKLP